jgi:hypothetical protein
MNKSYRLLLRRQSESALSPDAHGLALAWKIVNDFDFLSDHVLI